MVQSTILERYSEKQQAYAGYCLERLGFKEGLETNAFLEVLEGNSYRYKNYGNQEEVAEDKAQYFVHEDGVYKKQRYTLIDCLHDECQIKSKRKYSRRPNVKGYITATDLSNFMFCPVGYSIGRSIKGQKTLGAEIGTKLHDEQLLGKCFPHLGISGDSSYHRDFKDSQNEVFFDWMEGATLVFAGHQEREQRQYFKNEAAQFAGQPDYIFKDKDGAPFIVEEKFIHSDKFSQGVFHENHIVQLLAYLNYLESIGAQYGYLVYWVYESDYGYISYKKCRALKVELNVENTAKVEGIYEQVRAFRDVGQQAFDAGCLNAKKCGSCVHVMYCGHKNGRQNQVALPYSDEHLGLFRAAYPEVLKKD